MNQGYEPMMSLITLISPLQKSPDPMPIVGISSASVIFFAKSLSTLSRIIAETPTS